MIDEWWFRKDVGDSGRVRTEVRYWHVSRDWGKPQQISVRITGVHAEIPTKHPQGSTPESCRCANVGGFKILWENPHNNKTSWCIDIIWRWFAHQYPTFIPLRPHLCYLPCPSHLLHLIIVIMFGEAYRLWSFSYIQHRILRSLMSGRGVIWGTIPAFARRDWGKNDELRSRQSACTNSTQAVLEYKALPIESTWPVARLKKTSYLNFMHSWVYRLWIKIKFVRIFLYKVVGSI
jgi:hypothetical protein